MPGLTGRLTKPNKLTPAERGIRSGIARNIATQGAASVNKIIQQTVAADATERESLLSQFEVAGQTIPEDLIEQLDLRSELRRERATFEASDPTVAAQYTKQFDPVVMAENERILSANIGNLTRAVATQDAKIKRKGKLIDLATDLAKLQQTQVTTEGKQLDNTLKSFEAADLEITERLDKAFGGYSTNELTAMLNDGRMAQMNVPLARAHRYIANRRKNDIELQVAELGLRKSRADTGVAENKLRTSKKTAADASKQRVLLGMNTEQLSALSRTVRSQGRVVADGVEYTQVDVANALETVQTSGQLGRELKLQEYSNSVAADALITEMNEVGFMMNAAYGGGGDAYATMTIDDLADYRTQLEAQAQLDMPNDVLGQQKFVEDQMKLRVDTLSDKMGDLRKAAIARTSEVARPALIDVTTRGYITDGATAIRAMEDNLAAFATMEKGSYYSGAGRVMFNAVSAKQPNDANDGSAGVQALLGGGKEKDKFDAATIASKLTDEVVARSIVENVSGRIAQGGAVSAFAIASEALSEEQRQQIGNVLFDGAKAGMKEDFLLPDRPEQINWGTTVPELADLIFATGTGTDDDKLQQIESFFGLLEQGYVAPETVQNVTGQAKPRTLPEHQVWANARLVNDSVMPFDVQVANMLKNEAADLVTQTELAVADYRAQLVSQEEQRQATIRRNERGGSRPNLGAGNSGSLGLKRRVKTDEQFAAERLNRLAQERAANARNVE